MFKYFEQTKDMYKYNEVRTLIQEACESLMDASGRKDVIVEFDSAGRTDGKVMIGGHCFVVETKRSLSSSNFARILIDLKKWRETENIPFILVTEHVSDELAGKYLDEGINVLDKAGNCKISDGELFISINGRKSKTNAQGRKIKAMSDTEIRLTFHLLAKEGLVGETYRAISEVAGVSLGSIKNCMEDLTARGFIMNTDKGRRLIRRDDLVELWQERYNEVVKPKLFIKSLSFRENGNRNIWKETALPQGMSWGGDCGANIINGYLVPGAYEIYSSVPAASLITTGKVSNTPGEIKVYSKFWKEDDSRTAPLLIIYADLMGSGDARCIEAAQRLKENGI